MISMITDGNTSDFEQFGEDDDDEEDDDGQDGEWTPNVMLTEGGSDSGDEKGQTSEEMEGITTRHTTARRGTEKKYKWRKAKYEPPSVEFEECGEEDSELRCEWTPYMYFKKFVTDEMLQDVAEQTNLYSMQKNDKSLNTSAKEIEQVLGMYMHMGLVQMPSVRAYWEMETRHPAVHDVMPRDRFLKLLSAIHFQDNRDTSHKAKNDKLWKLRPWLQKLRAQFLGVTPEECHAIGVLMVPFKGKCRFHVYWARKTRKWGFKIYARVGQSGFLYDFDISQGTDSESLDAGDAGNVVLKMTDTLPAGKNHKVSTDDHFTSVPLVDHLKERGIHCIGTVNVNRVKNCNLMDDKDLRRKGRGSWDFRVNQDNTIIVRWSNGKTVNLLSSFVGIDPIGYVKGQNQKSKTHLRVPRPAIVETFNNMSGGLRLIDMLSTLYKFSFRSRRWYMYIWWHTITLAAINAWSLYIRDQKTLNPSKNPMALRRFQALVGTSLMYAGKSKTKCGRPLSPREPDSAPPHKRVAAVPADVRKDGIGHFPTWETRQRCKHCNYITHVHCEKCKVHLCLNKKRNCFSAFHRPN